VAGGREDGNRWQTQVPTAAWAGGQLVGETAGLKYKERKEKSLPRVMPQNGSAKKSGARLDEPEQRGIKKTSRHRAFLSS